MISLVKKVGKMPSTGGDKSYLVTYILPLVLKWPAMKSHLIHWGGRGLVVYVLGDYYVTHFLTCWVGRKW
jgi:hypothetical protein